MQNIELLRAMCSCKSKAVQALVQQAMGQVERATDAQKCSSNGDVCVQ